MVLNRYLELAVTGVLENICFVTFYQTPVMKFFFVKLQVLGFFKACLSRSHWKCTSGLQKHIIFISLHALLSCIFCCHIGKHVCFHLISNVHIARPFENRISFQTFKKWHNVSYRYVSYVKSETFDIWRAGAWFLKPFGERVKENHIYHLVKLNSTDKTRTVYRGCNVCYQVFLENGKIDFKSKIWNLNINVQT